MNGDWQGRGLVGISRKAEGLFTSRTEFSLTFRLGYIDVKSNGELGAACEETSKMLNGLIRSLRQQ